MQAENQASLADVGNVRVLRNFQLSRKEVVKLDRAIGLNDFPILPLKKKPALDWQSQYHLVEQKASDELIGSCFFTAAETPNVGVVCGPVSAGLVIQDFEHVETFVTYYPKWPELARTTRVVLTPHSGVHVYWLSLVPVRRSIKVVPPPHDLDVLGHGGYAVGAGSVIDHAFCDKKKCSLSGIGEYLAIDTYKIAETQEDVLEVTRNQGAKLHLIGQETSKKEEPRRSNDELFFDVALKKDSKLAKVYGGDCSGFKSRSEAEFFIVKRLVGFGFGDDFIRKIMDSSKTGKWQEKEESYRKITIEKARSFRAQSIISKIPSGVSRSAGFRCILCSAPVFQTREELSRHVAEVHATKHSERQ